MTAPKEIKRLIERFHENRDVYCSSAYNEAQARHEFIDPFFMALGWDVNNEKGYAEAYKEVIHEDAIKVGGATKAPDYAFRIGGVRKFFVEAKRPGVNIKEDAVVAYQLRRYQWSAKLALSILTDFEEFAVYDRRTKPAKTDKASTGRVLYLTADEYVDQWDEIAAIFSPESIRKGSFDKYAKVAKPRAEVDTAFLKEIEAWRDVLARNIALRNTDLSTRELNFAVQRTIDRIIFLRICEDRGIEEYGQLMALQNGTETYKRVCQIFRRADERYNSGLFHFRKEKDRTEPPDGLTLNLAIDDKALKGILKELYYPESPYEFSVLPADILGHIYEQFLGKVIRLTSGHHAKVEDKPEVKKAGGVYYTPTYIVDYIVEHTVGKLLDGKNPQQASKLRILDPACGSGSFLLGAYQTLLDWHLKWYSEHDAEKHARGRNPKIFHGPGGDWRLTTSEKKRILLNSIYGVDIDPQAVEVTKLSLLLKVLEGENEETLVKHLKLFHERALPDLADNIKCGNSLIGPDFYEGKQLSLIDEEERYRINAFDWHAEFPETMKAGGFDAVIGNPPWVSAWTGEVAVRRYLARKLEGLAGHWDLYLAFLLRTLTLLKQTGTHAFVYPTSVLSEIYPKQVREMLIRSSRLRALAVFGLERVFKRVSRRVCIMVVGEPTCGKVRVDHFMNGRLTERHEIGGPLWLSGENSAFSVDATEEDLQLMRRITDGAVKIGNIFYVNYGAQICSKKKGEFTREEFLYKVPQGNSKKYLSGSSIKRYQIRWGGEFLDYQPKLIYGPRHPKFFESPKIVVSKTSTKGYGLKATYDGSGYYCGQRLICLVRYGILEGTNLKLQFKGYTRITDSASDLYYTGLLNSRLLAFYFSKFVATRNLQGEYTDVVPKMVRALPVKRPDLSGAQDKVRHDRMVELVESMLKLHKDVQAAKTDHEKSLIQRQIEETGNQIDQLVYELYGLTDEEIRIVEEATK